VTTSPTSSLGRSLWTLSQGGAPASGVRGVMFPPVRRLVDATDALAQNVQMVVPGPHGAPTAYSMIDPHFCIPHPTASTGSAMTAVRAWERPSCLIARVSSFVRSYSSVAAVAAASI